MLWRDPACPSSGQDCRARCQRGSANGATCHQHGRSPVHCRADPPARAGGRRVRSVTATFRISILWRRRSGSRVRRVRRARANSPRSDFRWPGAGSERGRRRDGGSAGAVCGVVQRRRTSCRCQRRIVEGVTSSPQRRQAGRSRPRAAITARSVELIRGRGRRRCRTAS